MEAHSKEMNNLAQKVLNQMAKTLGMDPNDMKELFEGGMQSMRMNYCPPCPQPELVIGLNSHSDAAGLSILLQINEVDGLQIKKDGMWVPIKPLPDAFIINIGDVLEVTHNAFDLFNSFFSPLRLFLSIIGVLCYDSADNNQWNLS